MKEKIKKKTVYKYSPVLLHQADLISIVELINEDFDKLEFVTDDYRFDNLQELIEQYQGTSIRNLEIKPAGSWEFSLTLNSWFTELEFRTTDNRVIGLFHRVNLLMKKFRRRPYWLYSLYTIWGYVLGSWVVGSAIKSLDLHNEIVSQIDVVAMVLLIVVVMRTKLGRHSEIRFRSDERYTEFKKNILVPIVVAIVAPFLYDLLKNLFFQ